MNKRGVYRLIFIISFVWIALLLAFYFITSNYKNYAINFLKEYLDKELTTEIVVRKDQIHFSVFKNFPHISIWMENVLVKSAPGPNYNQISFQSKDTLLFTEEISFVFNLKSLFTNKYELRKVSIKNADFNLLFDKEGNGNYNILKKDQAKTDSFTIDLKKIEFDNISFNYIDVSSGISLKSFLKKAILTGKISDNNIRFSTDLTSSETNLKIHSKEYLKNENLKVKVDLIDNNDIVLLNKGYLNIFGASLNFTCNWNRKKDITKLLVETKESSLQKIKSLDIDNFYNKIGFYPLKGSLNAQLSLLINRSRTPFLTLNYKLSKAAFENKSGEIKLENVYLKGSYTNGKQVNKYTSVFILDSLNIESDKSEFSGKTSITNFENPHIKGILTGNIELSKIFKLLNLQSTVDFDGVINTKLIFDGVIPSFDPVKVSYLKNLHFDTKILFDNIKIISPSNSFPITYASGNIDFSTLNEINLEKISFRTGNTQFVVDGKVSNIPFLNENKDQFLTYDCKVYSPEFHIEDFLQKDPENSKKNSEFKVHFPDSIIIKASVNADVFSFGKFSATDVKGLLYFSPKTLFINNFYMNSQNGKIFSEIQVEQKQNIFVASCDATLDRINIRSLFESFNNFGQDVIKSENLDGNLSGHVKVIESWDESLKPIKEYLTLQADYEINDGEILNYQPLLGLSRFIELEELKHIHFQKLQSNISISNQTVYFSQTNIRSSATNLIGSGEHHFDNSYEYHFQVLLSDILWNKARKKKPQNTEFGFVVDDNLNRTALPLVIKGKGTVYEVNYDRKTAVNNFKEKINKEREELKFLLNNGDKDQEFIENSNTQENIDWNEIDAKNKSTNDSGNKQQDKNKEEQNDFSIQWDDN